MAIDERYVVNISGKIYLKYGGVLNAALEQGLKSLEVDLIQIPNESNGNVAICKATAVFEREGRETRFTEWGDAAPNNCAKIVHTALIRMAATRSKGRALRDAIGHGEALADEIGGDQEPHAPKPDWKPSQEVSPIIRDQFCSECGIELLPAVVTYSKHRFGKPLCRDHQPKTKVNE